MLLPMRRGLLPKEYLINLYLVLLQLLYSKLPESVYRKQMCRSMLKEPRYRMIGTEISCRLRRRDGVRI